MKHLLLLSIGLFSVAAFFGKAFGLENCNGTAKVGSIRISSWLPDYFATVTLPTKGGSESFTFLPCERVKWNNLGPGYCKSDTVTKFDYNDLEFVEIAPGIFAFDIGINFSPKEANKDIFCPRVQKGATFKEHANNQTEANRFASSLISAYESEVMGIVFRGGDNKGENREIYLLETPCGYWNDFLTYGDWQNVYANCKNSTEGVKK